MSKSNLEWAERITRRMWGDVLTVSVNDANNAVASAVLAEREACAQLVETTPVEACNCKTCMHDLAAAIRARGEREAT
jgi:hypothetical protein